nr:D-alanyl-D-alanine carboxypeptidase/D-alanyl-D-alanine-endopeptidase [Motilibacter deserti]
MQPATSSPGNAPAPAGVTAAVRAALGDRALGGSVGATVLAADGTVLLDRGGAAHTPASVAKLLTGTAALTALGPDTTLATRVVSDSAAAAGATPGTPGASTPAAGGTADIVLVGGGDATLQSGADDRGSDTTAYARLDVLAKRTAAALGRGATVRVLVDDSAFAAPAVSPDWEPGYVPGGIAAPTSALSVDQGRVRPGEDARVGDPALEAGRRFAALLRAQDLTVRGAVARRAAQGAQELARVESPPVARLVERMLEQSDNDLAEALVRLVAAERGEPATAAGGGAAVLAEAQELGIPVARARLLDGSGLARGSRVGSDTLAATLRTAASPEHPELRPVLTGLPVAGLTGTLAERYADSGPLDAARGVVRAKTGTLTGVSSLAGLVRDRDGGLLVFAFLADRVPGSTLDARQALDEAAAALAECGCRG